MEELIHEEVLQFNEQLDKELDEPISVRNKFNISVINGLWSIIAGKRYNLVSCNLFLKILLRERMTGFGVILKQSRGDYKI
jgi:hypothetical protein